MKIGEVRTVSDTIRAGEQYAFIPDGDMLARVLYFYGVLQDVAAAEYKVVCPFHEDINPSMIVNLDEGNYFCFGCGATGDAYRFVKQVNDGKMNDLQVAVELQRILRSDKVESLPTAGRSRRRKEQGRDALNIASDYYHGLLSLDWNIRPESDMIADEMLHCRQYMMQRGFTPTTLTRCGAKVTFNQQYPLIFPMMDNGVFRGWVCRTTNSEVEKKRKYLYNEGFQRATTLVGSYKNCRTVCVVEGYMDRLRMLQNGARSVVAILGWKITQEQVQKLKAEGVRMIVSALDNDECGHKGTAFLRQHFQVVPWAYEAGVKDPGDMTPEMFARMNHATAQRIQQVRK